MKKKIDFSKYSSIKIGPIVDVQVIDESNFKNYSGFLVGGANNLLISPTPPSILVLDKKYNYIYIKDSYLHIGAATPTGKIVSFCKKNNITNFEFLAHLPGQLGGVIKMNAGLKDTEIFNYIYSVNINSKETLKEKINFSYRYTDIEGYIFSAKFKIEYGFSKEKLDFFKKLRENQPSNYSAGSCFKNPECDYAGRLIEAVGLKGKRVGNMEFSTIHANFLVNHREDKKRDDYQDAMTLINEAKKRVLQDFNINLEEEITVLKS